MHDLHLANQILKTILDYAQKNKLKKVKSVKIVLGSIIEHGDEISPLNLEFNLRMLAKNTLAQDLAVKIKKIKGREWILQEIKGE